MFRAIANTFANCFKIPELKSRIIFTLLLLGICRVMAWITIPGLNGAELMKFFEEHAKDLGGSLLGMYSLFTGGAMQHCAVGSLGIMPYITATIIVQLLTAVGPPLSKPDRGALPGSWHAHDSRLGESDEDISAVQRHVGPDQQSLVVSRPDDSHPDYG